MTWEIGALGNNAIAWAEGRIRLLVPAHQSNDRENRIQGQQRILADGRPLDEATRHSMESWFGYDLSEVRVHDNRQAAELSQRLGAEAFAVQRHIFGPGEKLSARTPQGGGLLAHEITHVIQQTEPPRLSQGHWPEHVLVPQVARPTPQPNQSHTYALEPSSGEFGSITPSRIEIKSSTSPVSFRATAGVVPQATEAEAQVSEQIVSRALENEDREVASQTPATASEINPEEIADKVYHLMRQDLILERERGTALN